MIRRSDYILGIMATDGSRRNNNIGAGWLDDDGTIGIKLELGVVLDGAQDYKIRLFLRKDRDQ